MFAPDGALLDERRTSRYGRITGAGVLTDDERLFTAWMSRRLADVVAMHDVGGLMISPVIAPSPWCAAPSSSSILDTSRKSAIDRAGDRSDAAGFFRRPTRPGCPLGFSIARHLLVARGRPTPSLTRRRSSATRNVGLAVSGRPLAEWSYLGAHSQLWAPLKRDFSSLVDRLGWRDKFPEMPAGAVVRQTRVALPDGSSRSIRRPQRRARFNAALAYYRMTGLSGFRAGFDRHLGHHHRSRLPARRARRERDADRQCHGRWRTGAFALRFMGGRIRPDQRELEPADLAAGGGARDGAVSSCRPGLPAAPFRNQRRDRGGDVEGGARAVAALYVLMMTDRNRST